MPSKSTEEVTGVRIPAPLRLAEHVSKTADVSLDELIDRAEAAIGLLSDDFLAKAKTDLRALRPPNSDAESHKEAVYAVCHELRGLAGSLGAPLLTEIGASLCDFVKTPTEACALHREVIDLHIAAMLQLIAQHKSSGGVDGGEELLAGLLAARKRVKQA